VSFDGVFTDPKKEYRITDAQSGQMFPLGIGYLLDRPDVTTSPDRAVAEERRRDAELALVAWVM
jgi:hypothetical protein